MKKLSLSDLLEGETQTARILSQTASLIPLSMNKAVIRSLFTIIFLFSTATAPAQNIFPTLGNVGIGTGSPVNLLTINTGNSRNGIGLISGSSSVGGLADIALMTNVTSGITSGLVYKWLISLRNDGYFSASEVGTGLSLEFYGLQQGGGYYAPLSFTSNGNMVLVSGMNASSGNVLIGKTNQSNPNYKLDVNGNIRANKIVVNTTGADYVFDPGFSLLPLDSLRQFIAKYHHLPDIPSASKLRAFGVDVGEMQKIQLQKIEELTLYIIMQNRIINKQQKVIEKLSERIDKIESVHSCK